MLITIAFAIDSSFFNIAYPKSNLCCFNSKEISGGTGGCAKDMDAEIKEVKRELQISIVQVKVKNRGTYAGSIMFQMCCLSKISKNRGYRYFVELEQREVNGCEECEWYDEYVIGFLNSKSDSLKQLFKERYEANKKYKIIDINEFHMVCGFLPIPSIDFHKAVYFGDLAKIRKLSGKNSKLLNKKDEHGYRPLHIATVEGHSEIIMHLVSSGANINAKGMYGWTPLHLAVRFNRIDTVKLLLNLKADPGVKMDWGNTPLHNAAYKGSVEIADIFINSGVSVDQADNEGNSPLHGAASRGHLKMVKYLISKGADPKKKNKEGQTPLFFAEAQKYTDVIRVLKEYQQ